MAGPPPPRTVVLLGSQRFSPTLRGVTDALGIEGPFATITCGWQEREADDRDLHEHLQNKTFNLELHRRADEVLRSDPELVAAHRRKQEVLRIKQDFYRVRLELELEASRIIAQRKAPADILAEELSASLSAVRQLDDWHLRQCITIADKFDQEWAPWKRPSVQRHRDQLGKMLRKVNAIAIAGGHVATILNRMRMFGFMQLLEEHKLPIFAWAAGAMALSERVVLFHDSPPQGPGAPEVLDQGFGLVKGVVVLPHPEDRLKLEDHDRMGMMARRFAPARCVTFPAGTSVVTRGTRWSDAKGARVIGEDGKVIDLAASLEGAPEAQGGQ